MTSLMRFHAQEQHVEAVKPTSTRREQRRLLLFHIGAQAYALPLQEVAEIVPMAELFCPPNLPTMLAGFLNLGGTAVPVLRLDRLFDQPDVTLGCYTPLVLLRNPDHRLALLVEKVSRIIAVRPEAI